MTELGIIASVVQIADVGLRLSIKLYTFGEIVASADRSVISISKDVSLTSGVLKELGQLLDKDKETGTFSETAVQTADGVVKECLEVFKEMDNIIVKRLPSLGAAGKGGVQGERAKRATVMLERLKWGYLQPKLELLRSNLDSLKSTLLLMLNVITYARQVAEKAELPSVIAEQKCLIEDLAQSNQEYILKFERLKLGIEETPGDPVDDATRGGVAEREPSNITMSLSGTLTRKFKRMKSVIGGTSLQDKGNPRGFGSEEFNTGPWSSLKAQRSITGSLATPPNADTNNMFINKSVQGRTTRSPVQVRGIPTTEAPMAFGQEALFKQLEHHSMLIKNLLKEVDEAQYKITFQSRLRMKGGIAGLHEGERRDLEKMWGLTALQRAEQRLDPLIGELPRVNSFTAPVASANDSPFVTEDFGPPLPFTEEPVAEGSLIGQAPPIRSAIAMPHPASTDPSSTYPRDTTHRTDLLLSRPSLQPVHEARPQFFAELKSRVSNMPPPPLTHIPETPSDRPTVTRARRTRPALTSESITMRRAEIAQAKAEEQRKSYTIGKRKDTGDRIGGYTEPHQEDDTREGVVPMTTPFSRPLSPSAGKRSENIWRQDTDSASSSSVNRGRDFLLDSPIENYGKSPRSFTNNARLQPQPRNDVHEQGANAFDEGDTEELAGKTSNGEGQIRHGGRVNPLVVSVANFRRDSGDSVVQGPLAQHAYLPAPAPQPPAKLQPHIEQGESQLANEDLVDRLISLWTTVKP